MQLVVADNEYFNHRGFFNLDSISSKLDPSFDPYRGVLFVAQFYNLDSISSKLDPSFDPYSGVLFVAQLYR